MLRRGGRVRVGDTPSGQEMYWTEPRTRIGIPVYHTDIPLGVICAQAAYHRGEEAGIGFSLTAIRKSISLLPKVSCGLMFLHQR